MACDSEQASAQIQRVVKAYQSNAGDNLRGPSGYVASCARDSLPEDIKRIRGYKKSATKMVEQAVPQQREHQPAPIFMELDTKYERGHTELEGHNIVCFTVGGEHRLCLPQVLQTALSGFSMDRVQEVCQELRINLSRCNLDQLRILKMLGELPVTAPSCGLITKTDAERLVNKLLHSQAKEFHEPLTPNSFKVYHECFGKSKGVLIPERYVSTAARCIKCSDCFGLFSTEKFVGHTHKSLENRTVHWGFDPKNWRNYLHLAKDQDHKDSLQIYLEDLKCKFECSTYKRKEFPSAERGPNPKRLRIEGAQPSAKFQPWTPNSVLLSSILNEGKLVKEEENGDLPHYLHKGPPKLLNPERVVPFDHQKQYARHFAPNISLAPVPPKKAKCKEYQAAMAAAAEEKTRRDSVSSHPSHTDDSDTLSMKSETSASPPLADVATSHSQELELFHQALDTEPTDSHTRDRLLKDFLRLCQYKALSISGLTNSAHTMRIGMSSKAQRVAEFEKQIEALHSAADSATSKHRQQQHQIAEGYRQQLQAREAQYTDMHSEMLREVHRLREQLRGLGKIVPEIAYDLELIGDCPNIASPPDSPKPEILVKIKEEKV